MDAQLALRRFLTGALERRRERYLGFVAKQKTQVKFLNAIYHELERDLDGSKKIATLPSGRSPIPGYRFAPPSDFGSPVNDLREVCRSADDSFLVVSEDGEFGVHGPESLIDGRAIYRVDPTRGPDAN